MIPCANPRAQYLSHKDEIDSAILRVLDHGRYILGQETAAFEEEFAAYLDVKYGVGVGSGTEALHLALAACGIGANDEVITVSQTAVATVAAIEQVGARPVFVDIDARLFTLDPEKLEQAITPRTKAVIPVHLYGQPADLDPIKEITQRHGLVLIEDCAQAHGATYKNQRVGTFGDIGCFSFYPTKNLGAIGDGGALVTNDAILADKARLLREYGWAERYVSHLHGWNTRLDEIQAAVLRVKLRSLDHDNAKRMRVAQKYRDSLRDCGALLPATREDSTHVYHLFVIRSDRRNALQSYLQQNNIQALIHYPMPVHSQPAYQQFRSDADLSNTELVAAEVLSLPIFPEIEDTAVDSVIQAVNKFEF